jgi:hypothetical protein
MRQTLDPFVMFDAAFDPGQDDIDADDDPATAILEFLSSTRERPLARTRQGRGHLVSLIVERGQP